RLVAWTGSPGRLAAWTIPAWFSALHRSPGGLEAWTLFECAITNPLGGLRADTEPLVCIPDLGAPRGRTRAVQRALAVVRLRLRRRRALRPPDRHGQARTRPRHRTTTDA